MIVTYKKKFPTGQFLNEDIGFEKEVEQGQDPLEVLAELKALAEKFHIQNNPALYSGERVLAPGWPTPPYHNEQKTINLAAERLEKIIDDATIPEDLFPFREDAIKYNLQERYQKKMAEVLDMERGRSTV